MSATQKNNLTTLSPDILTEDQHLAIDFMYELEHSILRLPMGFGKTVCALTAASELLAEGEINRVLILAQLRVCDLTWAPEVRRWQHLTYPVAIGTQGHDDACAAINSDAPIVIINYEVFPGVAKKWRQASLNTASFDGLILDELTKLKEPNGTWHKSVRKVIKQFTWRVGLTGTMASEGLHHMYGMCRLIDGGKTFGRRKELFMWKYFTPLDFQRRRWAPVEGASDEIARLMAPFTLDLDTDDQDRPPLKHLTRTVPITADTAQLYRGMAEEMVVEIGDKTITAANAGVMTGKLQQLANGFIYDGEFVEGTQSLKMAVLEQLICEHRRAIIAYQYDENLREITARWPDAAVIGRGATRESARAAVEGWNNGDVDIVLLHPMSGGHGLNMQGGGNVVIFFNPLWSKDQTDQIIARVWRRGQKASEVLAITIATEDTVETDVIIPRQEGKGETADLFSEHLQAAAG